VAYRASIAPAIDHPFIRLVEGVLEIQEADHDAQRHARAPGVAGDRHALHLFAKEAQVRQGRTSAALAGENLPSQVMVEKAMTVKRDKVGPVFWRIDADALVEVERCLAVFLGIAK
jgi:hypothetical protein